MTKDRRIISKDGGLTGHVNAWLEGWGFFGNPFEKWDAGRETLPNLSRYYIKPPFYEQLLTENKSSLIYARRGGGKSAARLMLQSECQPLSHSSPVLAMSFTDFSPFAEDFTSVQTYTLKDYLRVILQSFLSQLLIALSTKKNNEVSLGKPEIDEFQYWLEEYIPYWRESKFLSELKVVLNSLNDNSLTTTLLQEALNNQKNKPVLYEDDRITGLLDRLSSSRNKLQKKSFNSSSQTMEAFIKFCTKILSTKNTPCHSLYLLIDGIDEYLLTQDDPQSGADLLKPLLGNIRFLETPGLAVKFFLPLEFRSAFESSTRPDRIPTYTISWSDETKEKESHHRMRELLQARLLYYSNGEIPSLSEMCIPELRHVIEDILVEESKGIPRYVLQLGNQIFIEHCRETPEPDSEIGVKDIDRALNWFRGTVLASAKPLVQLMSDLPTKNQSSSVQKSEHSLTIQLQSGRVYIGKIELSPLPDLEYRLLAYLYRRKGEICTRAEIIQAVYQDESGITDERLGSLVYRLRNALHELAPSLPKNHFIETASRRGYILQNSE